MKSGYITQSFYILVFLLLCSSFIIAQVESDSIKKALVKDSKKNPALVADTTKVVKDAALDIGVDRGLFISTADQKMQLRILGSIRYLADFDNIELENKNAFNTYEIPTGDQNIELPNYYNGLNQTRLGFEITRKTSKGNVFARLETDFAGPNGFRIRHAYGQYGSFLVGQTWSLFSQITALPATIDFAGPPGAIAVRTPQIRYFVPRPVLKMNLEVALEYVDPDLNIPDTLFIKPYQFLPAVTAQLDKKFNWGYLQISGIIPFLSARDLQGKLILETGWGLAMSTIIKTWNKGKWYLQASGGKAVTNFINNLKGFGLSVLFDPEGRAFLPHSYGGYVTYEHSFSKSVYSNFTYGMAQIEQESFTADNIFYRGNAFMFNTFWNIVEGAKIGGGVIWGSRENKNGISGNARRINLLVYYDF